MVSIDKNGGYMYAATHPYTVDENGNRKYVYCHWGVVDDNKKFIPGKRYVFASLEERARLIFPDDWDMSEAKCLSGTKQPGRPAYTDADKNRFYGDIWLLEQVADKTGLRSDLKQVFENNEEVVNGILTLAYFSVLTGYSYNRVARWQRIVRHIWKSTDLHKQFSSTLEVLDEMRSIRCVEHTGKAKHLTPFVGAQIDFT